MFFQVVFGGLGCPGQKTTFVQETAVLFALPPSTARPRNQEFLEQVWFLGLRAPGLQKTSWPNERWRIPLLCPAVAGQRAPCCSGRSQNVSGSFVCKGRLRSIPPREPAGPQILEAPVTLALLRRWRAAQTNSAPWGEGRDCHSRRTSPP